eukprot:TRINITY_DN9186_c0_g4_i1.p1 TRINITY_DN9186_c0_g4~~TRINITY_DN9186_c0_g4_i1.p1  ORF type:complete len:284 (-),score=59.41 TRINITY_DN9186_c0_g4_i1:211-1062(-)
MPSLVGSEMCIRDRRRVHGDQQIIRSMSSSYITFILVACLLLTTTVADHHKHKHKHKHDKHEQHIPHDLLQHFIAGSKGAEIHIKTLLKESITEFMGSLETSGQAHANEDQANHSSHFDVGLVRQAVESLYTSFDQCENNTSFADALRVYKDALKKYTKEAESHHKLKKHDQKNEAEAHAHDESEEVHIVSLLEKQRKVAKRALKVLEKQEKAHNKIKKELHKIISKYGLHDNDFLNKLVEEIRGAPDASKSLVEQEDLTNLHAPGAGVDGNLVNEDQPNTNQ